MAVDMLLIFLKENFDETSSFYKELLKHYIQKETKIISSLKEHIEIGLIHHPSMYIHNGKFRYNWKKLLLKSAKNECNKTLNIFITKQYEKISGVIGNHKIIRMKITGDTIININFHIELENKTKFNMNSKLVLVNDANFPFKKYPSTFFDIEHDNFFYKRKSFSWLKKALSNF